MVLACRRVIIIHGKLEDLGCFKPEDSLMLWKLLRLQNLERLWIPSRGQNFGNKLQDMLEPNMRPVRLRVYRNGRFH